jgi:hypothetical protein
MATAHSYLHITENSKQVTSYRELGTQKEQNRIPNEQDQTIKVFTIGAARIQGISFVVYLVIGLFKIAGYMHLAVGVLLRLKPGYTGLKELNST